MTLEINKIEGGTLSSRTPPCLKAPGQGQPGAFRQLEIRGRTDKQRLTVELLQSDAFVTTADIDYHDGERYPTLVRIDGTPAYLDDITKPLTKSEPIPAEKKADENGETE